MSLHPHIKTQTYRFYLKNNAFLVQLIMNRILNKFAFIILFEVQKKACINTSLKVNQARKLDKSNFLNKWKNNFENKHPVFESSLSINKFWNANYLYIRKIRTFKWLVCVCMLLFLLQYNQNNFRFSKRKKKHNSSKLDGSVIHFTFGKSINMLINVVPPNNF